MAADFRPWKLVERRVVAVLVASWGHGDLQMTLEVTSNLNNPC